MSPAAAASSARLRNDDAQRPHLILPRKRGRGGRGFFSAAHRRDDAALLVSLALVVAAAARSGLLADGADDHLGLFAILHRAERRLFCPSCRHLHRRRAAVGHSVPRPARLLDLVHGRDVGPQHRQPDDEPAAAVRVHRRADGDEHRALGDRDRAGDIPRDRVFRLQSLQPRPGAGGFLSQSDAHRLGGRDFCLRPGVAQRSWRRESGLVDHVFVHAADLRLLPGLDFAGVAAAGVVGAAADLCFRGHARALDRAHVPARLDAQCAGAQRRVLRRGLIRLPQAVAERAPPRLADPSRRINRRIGANIGAMCGANGRKALAFIRNGNGNDCAYLDDMTYHRHNAALQQAGLGSSMAIGEFGGAPAVPGDSNALLTAAPLYWFYEMSHAALNPARAWADATRLFYKNPVNPLSFTTFG